MGQEEFSFITIIVRNAGYSVLFLEFIMLINTQKIWKSSPLNNPTILSLKVKVKAAQSCLTLCNLMDYTVHGILQAEYWSEQPFPSPGDLPSPGIEPRSPTLQADSLPAELPGKPSVCQVGCYLTDRGGHHKLDGNKGAFSQEVLAFQHGFENSRWWKPEALNGSIRQLPNKAV